MELKGRIINKGHIEGEALVTKDPISFYGGVDPKTGILTDKDNELNGQSIKGKVLVFPFGKGSTVGPYTIYQLAKLGNAPLAMVNKECETIDRPEGQDRRRKGHNRNHVTYSFSSLSEAKHVD